MKTLSCWPGYCGYCFGGEFGVPEWKDIIIKEDHIIAVWRCDTGNPKPAKKASKKNGGSGNR